MKDTKLTELMMLPALALVMTLGLVVAAQAADDPIPGAGSVRAEGTGEAWAFGRGKADFTLSGEGTLTINHVLENQIKNEGEGDRAIEESNVIYTKFTGTVTVEGPSIAAHFQGGRVTLNATGLGSVVLLGAGRYWKDGQGPSEWDKFGGTVVMGRVPGDENENVEQAEETEDAEYEAQTVAVVREIQTWPYYSEWALGYPDAAGVLLVTRRYDDWCRRFPVAWSALYSHRGWSVWIGAHPFVSVFFGQYNDYVVWCRTYPTYSICFRNPLIFHHWRVRFPDAYASIGVNFSFDGWCRKYQLAARPFLRPRVFAQKKVVTGSTRTADVGRPRLAGQVPARRFEEHIQTQGPGRNDSRDLRVRSEGVIRDGRSGAVAQPTRIEARPSGQRFEEHIQTPRSGRDDSRTLQIAPGNVIPGGRASSIPDPQTRETPRVTPPAQPSAPARSGPLFAPAPPADKKGGASVERFTANLDKQLGKIEKKSDQLDQWYDRKLEKREGDAAGLERLDSQFDRKQTDLNQQVQRAETQYNNRVNNRVR